MNRGESNIDRLLKARAEIDEQLRRHRDQLTIVFTDVVGSTSYFDRYGDTAGFAMLHRHTQIAADTFTEFQGRVIKTIGDSVMAEFPEPAFAVRAAAELQRRFLRENQRVPERDRIQVRIGIHKGAAIRYEHDVYGDAVNMAARVTKRTGPAQILISRPVREAIEGESDLRCTWLGKVTFAGKAEPEDIFEVVWMDTVNYTQLRQNLTAAFVRGDLVAPGLSPDQLIQPRQMAASSAPAVSSPPPAAVTLEPSSAPAEAMQERFELLQELGSGGMGIVYKARDQETGETVALKVLKPEIATDPGLMERFRNELRIARRVTHKNICRIYDLHRVGRAAGIAMEFVEGESLRRKLSREQRLGLEEGLRMARQIVSGLSEVHAQGIVHRDLKPENVMLDQAGNVKLMDFGIARTANTALTVTGGIIGTPAYMAPEQAEGKAVDARTDIYALGLVLYEMFTGKVAFSGQTPVEVALKQIRETPSAPRELEPGVPAGLEQAILRCLEKEPAKRFQNVEELEPELIPRPLAAAADVAPAAPASPAPAPPEAKLEPGSESKSAPATVPSRAAEQRPKEAAPPPPAPSLAKPPAAEPARPKPAAPVAKPASPAAASRPAVPRVPVSRPTVPGPAARTLEGLRAIPRRRLAVGAGVVVLLLVIAILGRMTGRRPDVPASPKTPVAVNQAEPAEGKAEPALSTEEQAEPVAAGEGSQAAESSSASVTTPHREPVTVRANQLKRVSGSDPVYPLEAKKQGVSGNATLEARIGRDGRVIDLKGVSGNPLLVEAATQAVRGWRYQPYQVNGQVVSVQTRLDVPFRMTAEEERFFAALRKAEESARAGRYLEPANDSAAHWLRQARSIQPNNPELAALEQRAVQAAWAKIEAAREAKDYDTALTGLGKLRTAFPGRADLPRLEEKIKAEQQQAEAARQRAAIQPLSFEFIHRHPSLARDWKKEGSYCSGTLVVETDGSVRFDCAGAAREQSCDQLSFPADSIQFASVGQGGHLRLQVRGQGGFDFYGDQRAAMIAQRAISSRRGGR